MEVPVIVEYDPESGSYGASNPDFPVDGIGKTEDEAVSRFQNALAAYLEFMHEEGRPVPRSRHSLRSVAV